MFLTKYFIEYVSSSTDNADEPRSQKIPAR